MAKYKFKKDFNALGSNIVPPGAGIPTIKLKYSFMKDSIWEGIPIAGLPGVPGGEPLMDMIEIHTDNAINSNGTPFTGRAQFNIPAEIVLIVDEKNALNKPWWDKDLIPGEALFRPTLTPKKVLVIALISIAAYALYKDVIKTK